MSKHVVDPDLGVIAVDWRPDKPADAEPDAVIDVYEAMDQVMVLMRRYMKELEDAGSQTEYSEYEVVRRWAQAHLPLRPGERMSTATAERIVGHVLAEIVRLKKGEAGSSPPA